MRPIFLRPLCPTCCKSMLLFEFAFAKTGRRGRFQMSHFQTTVPCVPLLNLCFRLYHSSVQIHLSTYRTIMLKFLFRSSFVSLHSRRCYSALSVRRKPAKIVKFSVIRSSWKQTKNVSESMGLFHKQVIPLTT